MNEAWRDGLNSCSDALALQCTLDLVQDRRIIDGRRHGPRSAVGGQRSLRLRQPGDGYRQLEGSDRADLLANEADTARSQRRAGSRPPLIR